MILQWLKGIGKSTPTPSKKPETQPAQHARKSHKKRRPRKKNAEWQIEQFQVPEMEGKTRFHDLELPAPLMHAIADLEFQYCSPIQAQILPHTLCAKDAIGKAQTGTGKTAAFLIAVIDDLMQNPIAEEERYIKEPRALVVAPTRELVVQIAEDAKALVKHTDITVSCLIGGADYTKQLNEINRRPVDIVVATPGRLIDFLTRGDIFLDGVESLVLDEADRMLDMGFIPQVKRIVRATPHKENRQTQLFSATFTQDILNLSRQWTKDDAVFVEIEPENVATDTVEQLIYMVSNEDKFKVLNNILKQPEVKQVIIFANRRDQTQKLFDSLKRKKLSVGILSGEISQQKRSRTLEAFKTGELKILVATDVVGRGIHIDGITHVINYNLPEDPEDYVHRIGRTGRAGASGISISLACEYEAFQVPTIEALLDKKLNCVLPPEHLLP